MSMRVFSKLLNPIQRKLRLMITRGVVKLIDPSTLMQELQLELLSGEVLDRVEHFEQYGFSSHPQPGAEVLAGSVGADRAHTVAFCVADRRYRLRNLAPGEVALSTDEGDVIHFKRGNEILISSANKVSINGSTIVEVNGAAVNFNGNTGKVVTTDHICSFTGGKHPDGCPSVKAG